MLSFRYKLTCCFGVMTYIDAFGQIDDIFRDIRGMIGYPLQIMRREHQAYALRHALGVVLHKTGEFFERRVLEFIHHVVGHQYAAG